MAEQKPNGVAGVVLGAYRTAQVSGLTTGMAAGDGIFAFQWATTDSRNPLCALTKLRVQAQIVTPFTAAQEIIVGAFVARAFTVADSGGNPLTLTGNIGKLRTSYGTSLVSDARICTTSALTAGTRTLDSQPIFRAIGAQLQVAASAAFAPIADDFSVVCPTQYPLVFAQNEGVIIRNDNLMGAGGTVRFSVSLEWIEFLPLSS